MNLVQTNHKALSEILSLLHLWLQFPCYFQPFLVCFTNSHKCSAQQHGSSKDLYFLFLQVGND